ncbi:NADPH-dependent 7-cyano-7-deazaguanine reductase [Paenibacillus tyrfis]|uniref:hypothetical protein n=1 Tax=Paenibacillus tyrfis TaxID=1501230 RepID=UPI002490669E|nr:hypothetical protein [Paenibacillus tyrfis]GLI06724.1 NADPH-dependent 7-cyano-7-deazaguanine reductase [Paenibacillus tyrfis]
MTYDDGSMSPIFKTIPNKYPERDHFVTVKIAIKECDSNFSKIVVSYIPDKLMLEAHSLESIIAHEFTSAKGRLLEDLLKHISDSISPRYIEVEGTTKDAKTNIINWGRPNSKYYTIATKRLLNNEWFSREGYHTL